MIRREIRLFFNSLSGRLVLSVLLIQLITTTIFVGLVLYQINTGLREQFTSDVRSASGLLLNSLSSHSLDSGHTENLSDILDEAILSGHVIFARLILADGNQINSTIPNLISPINLTEDLAFGEHGDTSYIIKLNISFSAGSGAGVLWLGFDEAPTNELIKSTFQQTSGIVMLYLITSILLIAYWGAKVTRPLKELSRQSREIATGRYHQQLKVDSSLSDIEGLVLALDHMRSSLVSNASEMQYQALHDDLTGLPNRALLNDRLKQAIVSSERTKQSLTFLLTDLDNFKSINDNLGHYAGDLLLQEYARRLVSHLRGSDTIARLGGDEFAILLHDVSLEDAIRVADTVVNTSEQPFEINDQVLHISSSIGIASYPKDSKDGEDLMRKADLAMYHAKKQNLKYAVYSSDMDRHSQYQLGFVNDLHNAIQNKELITYFQPIVDIQRGGISGAEALARWIHPERGLVEPNLFIALAEDTGQIDAISKVIFDYAFRHYAPFVKQYPHLRLAVNLSAYSLSNDNLPAIIKQLLDEADYPGNSLDIEITESALLRDPKKASNILYQLQEMNIHIAIDDFGTGYSSLAYLKQLPITELKIDMSFIADMLQNRNDLAIVRATIGMAHDMDIMVIAEGVSNAQQLHKLIALGCDKAQGFYFAKPMPIDKFIQWHKEFTNSDGMRFRKQSGN